MVYECGRVIIKVPNGPIIPKICYKAIVARGRNTMYFWVFYIVFCRIGVGQMIKELNNKVNVNMIL